MAITTSVARPLQAIVTGLRAMAPGPVGHPARGRRRRGRGDGAGLQPGVHRDAGSTARRRRAPHHPPADASPRPSPQRVFGRADARSASTARLSLRGAVPVLLTGDNPRAAAALADRLGIGDVRAGLLPEDKVAAVRTLQRDGSARRQVLLVGDGVNDAPALAAADVGIAMGGVGSDLALDSADAVVIRDDLSAIPAAVTLSRRARRLIIANLAIAGSFIAVLAVWDLFAHLPLPLGVLGHEGSTVIVGLNGLRLLRRSAWEGALPTPRTSE